jgi:type IV pilus assembly protein PilC
MATQVAKTFTYTWEGTDKQGRTTKGELSAISPAVAKAQLRRQGIMPKAVKVKSKPLFSSKKPIKPADIAVFARQLATMMKAGVPLVQSFDIVSDGLENPSMKELVQNIRGEIASGSGIASSLAKYPQYFDDLFVNLIGSGEQAGTLETMLDRVATYKEKTERLKAKIKKALTYPIAVLVVALIVTGLLLVKVVPVFAETFKGFGAELPAFTQFVLTLSEAVQAWWYIILGALIAAVYSYAYGRRTSDAFLKTTDRYNLKLPVIGGILYNSVIARFSRTLSTTFAAGVPLVEALDSVAGAAGNVIFRDAIKRIRDDVTGGQTLYNSIRATDMFPNLLLQMVAIGEESGALDSMLEKVALHYENLVDDMVDNMTALLEPLIMSVLGVLVGGLMIAMYLPIFMMGSVV